MKKACRNVRQESTRLAVVGVIVSLATFTLLQSGCAPAPSRANAELRRKNQDLVQQVASLERQLKSTAAPVSPAAVKSSVQLSQQQTQLLFLTSKVTLTRLSIGDDLDPARVGDEGFKVTFTPEDQFGHDFKTAGSVRVELFDLQEADTRLGIWELPTAELRQLWISSPVLDGYVVTLPWKQVPKRESLLVKITFIEELTGRMFEDQRQISVKLPGVSPISSPSN